MFEIRCILARAYRRHGAQCRPIRHAVGLAATNIHLMGPARPSRPTSRPTDRDTGVSPFQPNRLGYGKPKRGLY